MQATGGNAWPEASYSATNSVMSPPSSTSRTLGRNRTSTGSWMDRVNLSAGHTSKSVTAHIQAATHPALTATHTHPFDRVQDLERKGARPRVCKKVFMEGGGVFGAESASLGVGVGCRARTIERCCLGQRVLDVHHTRARTQGRYHTMCGIEH
jgi:hypothetical protein